MPNLFKSTHQIIELYSKKNAINKILKNHQDYWAHSANQFNNKPETLVEHLDLVQKYCKRLIKHHGLDIIIDNLISEYLNERSEEHTSELQSRGHLVCRLLLEKKYHI